MLKDMHYSAAINTILHVFNRGDFTQPKYHNSVDINPPTNII